LSTAAATLELLTGFRASCVDTNVPVSKRPQQAGTPVDVVAARLGHAKVEMTLNTYAHALPSQQADAATRLGAPLHG